MAATRMVKYILESGVRARLASPSIAHSVGLCVRRYNEGRGTAGAKGPRRRAEAARKARKPGQMGTAAS